MTNKIYALFFILRIIHKLDESCYEILMVLQYSYLRKKLKSLETNKNSAHFFCLCKVRFHQTFILKEGSISYRFLIKHHRNRSHIFTQKILVKTDTVSATALDCIATKSNVKRLKFLLEIRDEEVTQFVCIIDRVL